jgi:hypothetical protein
MVKGFLGSSDSRKNPVEAGRATPNIPALGKPRLQETAERVVKLYGSWGKKEKANERRKWIRAGLLTSGEIPRDPFAQP